MPSIKSKRTPPARNFTDYIFTRESHSSSGLLKINPEEFTKMPGVLGTGWADGDNNTDISSPTEIGFKFQIGGVEYTHFVASINGWMALVDPAIGTFNYTDIFVTNDSTDIADNYRINSSWRANHLLLAPWFDDLRNLADKLDTTESASPYPFTSQPALDIYKRGYWWSSLDLVLPNRDPYKYGVSYCRQERTSKGKRLIVQWNSTVYAAPTIDSVIRFEVAIYENGKIEFNYAPRSTFALYAAFAELTSAFTDPSSATIGIFMNGAASWRFRDLSVGLGYRDSERSRYIYGGSVYDSAYADTDVLTVPYNVNLKFLKHWPGQNKSGTTFTFQPPLNRRKILPRALLREMDSSISMPTVVRTGDKRMGNDASFFDDRNTVLFQSNQIVNYPTTLPRFYADTAEGVTDRQDLFANDFLVTGSIVKSSVEQFLLNKNEKQLEPFSEYKLFENDPNATSDPFFSAGTRSTDGVLGFAQPLRSKTQIRLSFRVDDKTTMYEASSSIYFYNSRTHRWQYPDNACKLDTYGVNEVPNPRMDIVPGPTYQSRIIEVDRGFNAYGISICSGSASTADRQTVKYNGTDSIFNSHATADNSLEALGKIYTNSLQNNSRYYPTNDEKFTIPINHPFLIEKAVIEIPVEAGPTWFLDKTQCFLPTRNPFVGNSLYNCPSGSYVVDSSGQELAYPYSYRTNAFDIGGPGLTVSLFNNVRTGVSTNRLDLILSGTITHHHDNETEIKLYDYESDPDKIWQIVPRGFNAYGTPSAVVRPTRVEITGDGISFPIVRKEFFTGSVAVKSQAAISNGVIIRDTTYLNHIHSAYFDQFQSSLEYLFSQPTWYFDPTLSPFANSVELVDGSGNKTYLGFREKTIVGVNNIGRGSTGFEPSGRSIFGKESVTSNEIAYKNSFYEYKEDSTTDDIITKIVALKGHTFPQVYATQVVTKQKVLASPYLVFPGDKLTLSVSKTRPFFYDYASSPYTSGSVEYPQFTHDIKLKTGSINITLYGSLVSNGREYHDTLNQPLASEATHEVFIGGTK